MGCVLHLGMPSFQVNMVFHTWCPLVVVKDTETGQNIFAGQLTILMTKSTVVGRCS